MLRHYFRTAVRNLLRNKLFTGINVLGLSIATGVFLALISYVQYHFSFDKFYQDSHRIFRIDYHEFQEGQAVLQSARTHDRTALLVHEYVPEAEAVTRIERALRSGPRGARVETVTVDSEDVTGAYDTFSVKS